MEDPLWRRASAWLAEGGARRTDAPRLALLGVPLAQASISPSGADATPAAVREALRRFATVHAGTGADLDAVTVTDFGDLPVADLPNEAAQDAVASAVARRRGQQDLLVLLGGDNALTRPALRALAGDKLATAGLVTLDAHHDVRAFHAGPTNGTPVRGLIEDGLEGRNVVQVGIGAFTNAGAYREYCAEQGITVVTAASARADGVAACLLRHLDALAERCDALYVDLDVDVLDAAFAPACPGARPGGLQPHELHDAALAAGRHPRVAAIDVVEVDATRDPGGVTVDNAALCLLHAAAGLALRRRA